MDEAVVSVIPVLSFSLVEWSFSDRKWMERGQFASAPEAFEATKMFRAGYYRIDDTNYARGEIFYTGKDSSLYPRMPRGLK